MRLYIKHMVCFRCIMVVRAQLEKLGISYTNIDLGIVDISTELTQECRQVLKENLAEVGLELYENQKSIITEQIKKVIYEMIFELDEIPRTNYSEYISEKLDYDYMMLAKIFSEMKGITIQQYIIFIKINRVKELLMDDMMSLSDISYKMNYSSVAHLSNQFKKHTGLTPSCFKQLMADNRGNTQLA